MRSPGRSSPSPEALAPLPKEFYLAPVADVAKALLGKGLFVLQKGEPLLAEIVETEAYFEEDPASHSYAGNTKRTWPMFEAGGTCYVYVSYGINLCMNVATGPKGRGEAVLLRAARPLVGQTLMFRNRTLSSGRSRSGPLKETALLSGPGKLTQAFGIGLRYNGLTFDRDDFKLVDLGNDIPSRLIARSPRIGITKARDELLRFAVKGSPWLSRPVDKPKG